jgi:tRNA-dihydrouridine synthase A
MSMNQFAAASAQESRSGAVNRPARTLSVAPMMDWTDTYCRSFHRALAPNTWLYTEMVTTGALIHGDRARFLAYDACEHPVAYQLGGSEPDDLAQCARWVEQAGYDEVNLNCGCPSERVQRGAFGACLMAEPQLVADCVKAMVDAVSIDVTVKHRIGLDANESEGFVHDFIGRVGEAGCRVFIVHARNAILKGLSPKENREIPPLRYEVVYRLRQLFPDYTFIINGGIQTAQAVSEHLQHVDGVMLGRHAWHQPWDLKSLDQLCYGSFNELRAADLADAVDAPDVHSRVAALRSMRPLVDRWLASGVPLRVIAKPWLGLFHGQAGGRLFRQVLSDPGHLNRNDWSVVELALAKCVRD